MEKYNKIKLNMTNYFPKIKNFEENIYLMSKLNT